jgi:uncharacterized paraquat-inducible protein A
MSSKWEQIKKVVTSDDVKPWDLLKPSTQYVSDDEAGERYSVCLKCPELNELTKRCNECGCFMAVKTKLKLAVCPLNKW